MVNTLLLEVLALIVAIIFFLVGLTGTLFPVLPGAPLIWLGMLIYALIAGFTPFDTVFFVTQALLALVVMGIDYLFSALGSRYFGGSQAAFWGAAVGLLVGLFFFPLGLLVGPFLGATLAELIFGRYSLEALKAGFGAFLGFFMALPAKLLLEAGMITWFAWRIINH